MSNQKIDIDIKTTADTKGAVDTEKALGKTGDAGQTAGKKTKDAAQAAEGSIEALESELKTLQDELRRTAVGGDEFVRLAGKVKVAETSLSNAEMAAKKLGATTGRSGNAGMAMLEFSRLTEDAQYGLRGILNNVPTLIMQLGGTAGLAGVISIVAVAATQLWERFGSGAKSAEDDINNIIERSERLNEAYKALAKINIDERTKKAEDNAKGIADAMRGIDTNLSITADQQSIDAAKRDGEERVRLAQQAFDLAVLEAAAMRGGLKEAIVLADKRLAITKENLQREFDIAEARRNDAANAAREKFTALQEKQQSQKPEADRLYTENEKIQSERLETEERITQLVTERTVKIQELTEKQKKLNTEIGAILERSKYSTVPDSQVTDLANQYKDVERQIGNLKSPSAEETDLKAKLESGLAEEADKAAEAYKKSAEEMRKLNEEASKAAQALSTIRERNITATAQDKEILKDKVATTDINATNDKEKRTIDGVRDIVSEAEKAGGGSKELQAVIAEAKAAINDGVLSTEELQRLPLLFSQFSGQLQGLKILPEKIADIIRDMDNLKRAVQAIPSSKAIDPRTGK